MKESAMRKNSQSTLDRLSCCGPAKSWDEAIGRVHSQMNAERCLELCKIFDQLSDEERERLAAIPAYKTDLREVGDIRNKYGVSWSELDQLRRMAW